MKIHTYVESHISQLSDGEAHMVFWTSRPKNHTKYFLLFILYVFRGKFIFVFGWNFHIQFLVYVYTYQKFYGPKSKISIGAFCSFLVEFIILHIWGNERIKVNLLLFGVYFTIVNIFSICAICVLALFFNFNWILLLQLYVWVLWFGIFTTICIYTS